MNPKKPVDWVDPLIDSASRRFFFFTSASHPFGMVNLSPDTSVGINPWKSGYKYDDSHIHWFSHVHAWQLCGIPVLPTMGTLRGHEGSEVYKSRFSHDEELVKAGYHQVNLLDYNIQAELTASVRVGFHRYQFNEQGEAWVNLDLGAKIMLPMSDTFAIVENSREIKGYVENERTVRRPKRTKIFFKIVFDRDIEETSTWKNSNLKRNSNQCDGPNSGMALKFSVEKGDIVQMKVAISYCGSKEAEENLRLEIPHWDFEKTREEASDSWNTILSRIQVEGGSDQQMTKFYTDLFHSVKGRRRVSDAKGTYLDMTGDLPLVRSIPLDRAGQPQYEHHNSDAFWGAPWSLNIIWPILCPEYTSNFCNTLVDMYKNGGLIPRGPSGGNYTHVMTSPSSTTFLVSAWLQGIQDFDIEAAFEGMMKNHSPEGSMAKAGYEHYTFVGGRAKQYCEKGYVPHGIEARAMHTHSSATMTLEYAYHDWALAQLAHKLGKEDEYQKLMKRSKNYQHHWDEKVKFFRPKSEDGEFIEPFELWDVEGYVEGNAQHYRWYVPHDVQSLIALMGGRDNFIQALNQQFEDSTEHKYVAPGNRHYSVPVHYGNQPCMYLAHLFNYAGAPSLSQKWVREVVETIKSDITPYGGYGGDEDQGQMGSLNALMSIGLFSVNGMCQEDPVYELTTPLFKEVKIHLSDQYHGGKILHIQCHGAGSFIKEVKLNERLIKTPFIHHREIIKGGRLEIELCDDENSAWGRD